jgi:hypothetical protein
MTRAHVSIENVQRSTGVDAKTDQRWLGGRVPHRRHRWAVAALLGEDEAYLWPESADHVSSGAGSTAEVVAAYAHRADIPSAVWTRLIDDARRRIDILGYAVLFLPEAYPGLALRLAAKADDGCGVRIALADAESPQVLSRDAEERLDGGLVARIGTAMKLFGAVTSAPTAELRLHRTPMYNSVFRFDDQMIVTPHVFGRPGFEAPALHLRRLGDGGIFDNFAQHFEDLYAVATPAAVRLEA